MILVIHTLDHSQVQLALLKLDRTVAKVTHTTLNGRQTEQVMPLIDQLLKKSKVSLPALQGIVVATGPGGFTAVRSGVVVANSLGFALGIPVVGVEGEFTQVEDMLASNRFTRAFTKLKRAPKTTQARPAYGAQPNISKAKHKKVQQHKLKV